LFAIYTYQQLEVGYHHIVALVHGHNGVLAQFGVGFAAIEAQLDAENPSLARNVIAAFDAVVLH
jgi:hypothetical protein